MLKASLAIALQLDAGARAGRGARPRRARPGCAEPGDPTSARPGILSKIEIDQKIGSSSRSTCRSSTTRPAVKLGDYFGKRPVVLALVYYECPMLCTQVLNGLVVVARDAEPSTPARTSTSSP